MNRKHHALTILLPAIAMMALILDGKTAVDGATDGIELCIHTVIPSLYPFILLTIILTKAMIGCKIPFASSIGKLCGMPPGSEALLIVGLIGGYPTGAQAITEAYRHGSIPQSTALRLLGFCSNAGPAFIFGICSSLFSKHSIVWILWFVHIISAIISGILLPKSEDETLCSIHNEKISIFEIFRASIRIIAEICGWIILFRVLIAFLNRWLLWLLPKAISQFVIGCLELANGIIGLQEMESETVRFVICSVLLSLGGLCVGMQTISVTGHLGTGWYFPGKILQSIISMVLSVTMAQILFDSIVRLKYLILIYGVLLLAIIFLMFHYKKVVAFIPKRLYNTTKS